MTYEIGGGDGFKKFKEFIIQIIHKWLWLKSHIKQKKNLRGEGVDGLISHLDWSPHHS